MAVSVRYVGGEKEGLEICYGCTSSNDLLVSSSQHCSFLGTLVICTGFDLDPPMSSGMFLPSTPLAFRFPISKPALFCLSVFTFLCQLYTRLLCGIAYESLLTSLAVAITPIRV